MELLPMGVQCSLACSYCYEDPMRAAGNHRAGYSLDAMKRGLESGGDFSLFGGEPLLMPFADLEEMFRWGFERTGRNNVQTNGELITPAHIGLFDRYAVSVGISVDGPHELNDARWAGTLEKTRAATARSFAAIDALVHRGRIPSLIITLSRQNASAERLPILLDWFRQLDQQGIKYVRLHLLEIDDPQARERLALTDAENITAMLACARLQSELRSVVFDVFPDLLALLTEDAPQVTCIWNGCDPLTTPAVRGVNGLGESTNCSRTNKDGIDWVKADRVGGERYLTLYETPQADGGCKDCRFFFACKSNCPGTAIDGDWRNRTEHCAVWFRLFSETERQLVNRGRRPISLDPPRLNAVTRKLLDSWEQGKAVGQQEHQDHWDCPEGFQHADAGLTIHGDQGVTEMHQDIPHGDSGSAVAHA